MRVAPGKFSWKQGLVHALLPLAYVLLVGGTISALRKVADSFAFGQALGRSSVFLMLLAFGLSYMAQTGNRRLAVGLAIALTVVIVGATITGLVVLLSVERASAGRL